MYEVLLERAAQRDLRRLTNELYQRITPGIKTLAENPRPAGSRKIIGSESDWRLCIGDYRVVYEVDQAAMVARLMRVRHRREVYRKR